MTEVTAVTVVTGVTSVTVVKLIIVPQIILILRVAFGGFPLHLKPGIH